MRCWSGTAIYPALFKDLKDKYAALQLSNRWLAVVRSRCDLLLLLNERINNLYVLAILQSEI